MSSPRHTAGGRRGKTAAGPLDQLPCHACQAKETTIKKLRQQLDSLEKSFHAVVAALKQEKASIRTKDNLISQLTIAASTASGAGGAGVGGGTSLTRAQQERIAELEANISELSTICGEYKRLRTTDRLTIEQLSSQLRKKSQEGKQCSDQGCSAALSPPEVKLFRSRAVQTDPEEVPVVPVSEAESQTDLPDPAISSIERILRRPELAVVIPTQSFSDEFSSATQEPASLLRPDSVSEGHVDVPPAISPLPSMSETLESVGIPALKLSSLASRPRRESASSVNSCSQGQQSSLVYVNELARKEVELAEVRLKAREYECALRELQWTSSVERFRLKAKVTEYEKQEAQRMRENKRTPCLPADQAKLIYVKNVMMQYVKARDAKQRKIMLNALLTALEIEDRV